MKSDHGTDGILKREGYLMCDASTKESRLMDDYMDDYRRDGALEALRSKFGEITVRLQDAIIPRRGRFNKNAKSPGAALYDGFCRTSEKLSMPITLTLLAILIVITLPILIFVNKTNVVWMLTGMGTVAGSCLLSLVPQSFIKHSKKMRSRLMKKWNKQARLHFNENRYKIHSLEEQLLTISQEYDSIATSDDLPLPLDVLFSWYVNADLPMSDTMQELFSRQIKQDKEVREISQMQERGARAREEARNDEMNRITKILEANRNNDRAVSVLKNSAPGEALSKVHNDPSNRLHPLTVRIDEIGRAMEESESGSGRNFIAEMSIPFDSLYKLEELLNDGESDEEMESLFFDSMRLFDRRLSREEERLQRLKADKARQEHKLISEFLA